MKEILKTQLTRARIYVQQSMGKFETNPENEINSSKSLCTTMRMNNNQWTDLKIQLNRVKLYVQQLTHTTMNGLILNKS